MILCSVLKGEQHEHIGQQVVSNSPYWLQDGLLILTIKRHGHSESAWLSFYCLLVLLLLPLKHFLNSLQINDSHASPLW